MTSNRCWKLASAWFLTAVLLSSCASGGERKPIDLSKLPPIVIAVPGETPNPTGPAPAARVATIAFQVVDACTGAALPDVFARFEDNSQKQTNADGYVDFVKPAGQGDKPALYKVRFLISDEYENLEREFALTENRQFRVTLRRAAGCPKPEPQPVPTAPTPKPEPAPVQPHPPAAPEPSRPMPPAFCLELECVRQAAVKYPQLLVINLFESCMEFTQHVLALLGPDWGHVGKIRGEHQSVPRGFAELDVVGVDGKTYRITGVSHDAIKHRLTGQVIDILGNATANEPCPADVRARGECWPPGPASIAWTVVPKFASDGRLQWRDENPFVPAVPVAK